MPAKRICFSTLGYPPAPGGVARSASRVVRYLVEEGCDVHVFTVVFGEPYQSYPPAPAIENGVTVTTIPWDFKVETSRNILAFYSAIQDADAQLPFDLFHGYFLPFAYPCLLVAAGRRVIASIRGDDAVTGLCSPEFFPFINVVLQKASWITSVNSDQLRSVSGLADLGHRSSVIPNSIDAAAFSRHWRPTATNRGIVGTIGTRPSKAVPLLIEAYAGIDRARRAELRIIGPHSDAKEEGRIREAIERHAVAPEVRIVGAVPHEAVPQELLSMRVYVQSSNNEGLPNAVLEAAATGVPIVATGVGGLKDILRDGESALVVPRRNPAALTAAITAVLSDDNLALRLSHGASQLARRLGPANEKRAWLDVYSRCGMTS